MSILGNRVLRIEDPRLLTRGGTYLEDVELPGAAHIVYVRSPIAHARITAVDISRASAAPGVVAVYTAEDVDLPALSPGPRAPQAMARPVVATGVVRFLGELVAAVVAQTRAQAVDAAELVMVDYDPLPVVVDPEASPGSAALLFPDEATNVADEFTTGDPDIDAALAACEVVVEQRVVNQRISAAPLETRGAAARWSDGRLTYWVSTQGPHLVHQMLTGFLGLNAPAVRVVAPDVGGGFGTKVGLIPEELLVAWICRRLQRAVRWTETRNENFLAGGHGRAQVHRVRIGGTRDGRIEAYALDILADAGAYPLQATTLTSLTRMMAQGVYDIPHVRVHSRTVVTNTSPVIAFRGAGRPEATAAIERAVDLFATEIGADPADVRRRNAIPPEAFPYTALTGRVYGPDDDVDIMTRLFMTAPVYDCGDYTRALDRLLDLAGYRGLRAEQRARRERGDAVQLGLGLSLYVEVTSIVPGVEQAAMAIGNGGRVSIRLGSSPQGQGHATTWAIIARERLGVPLDRIDVEYGDTDVLATGNVTGGSRSVQTIGNAVAQSADLLVERARALAGDALEADVADIMFDRQQGVFHVAGAPFASRSWAELAERAGGTVAVEHGFSVGSPSFPFGAHLAVVEVDTETGAASLRRFVGVDDAGTIINPLTAEGQLQGGIAMGAAQALLESIVYDADGNLQTSTFADYEVITAAELPDFELEFQQTPTPLNDLGAKGIGESGTIGSPPAVQNAVVDALSHLGVRHIDMPCAPERVLSAISAARSATGASA